MEYLKNVLFKFITLPPCDEKKHLLPVMDTMLKFDQKEKAVLMEAAAGTFLTTHHKIWIRLSINKSNTAFYHPYIPDLILCVYCDYSYRQPFFSIRMAVRIIQCLLTRLVIAPLLWHRNIEYLLRNLQERMLVPRAKATGRLISRDGLDCSESIYTFKRNACNTRWFSEVSCDSFNLLHSCFVYMLFYHQLWLWYQLYYIV